MKNIVLIGMPGSGKTTVGELLAEKLHMELVDMDQAIEAEQGTSISNIFAVNGEASFRQMETAKAIELSERQGLVISTGGGVVTRQANMEALCKTGLVCFLDRSLEQLLAWNPHNSGNADNTRPLLAKDREANLRRLYGERISLYRKYSDIQIPNDGTAQEALEKILEKIKEMGGCRP